MSHTGLSEAKQLPIIQMKILITLVSTLVSWRQIWHANSFACFFCIMVLHLEDQAQELFYLSGKPGFEEKKQNWDCYLNFLIFERALMSTVKELFYFKNPTLYSYTLRENVWHWFRKQGREVWLKSIADSRESSFNPVLRVILATAVGVYVAKASILDEASGAIKISPLRLCYLKRSSA